MWDHKSWVVFLSLYVFSLHCAASDLRVKILSKYHPKSVIVYFEQDQEKFSLSDIGSLDLRFLENFELEIPSQGIKRQYKGGIWIERADTELVIINWVDIEDYVPEVVLGEIGLGPEAAMQAQAVLARSYAKNRLRPHKKYDISDLAYHQVYPGLSRHSDESRRRIEASRYQTLKWNGNPIQAVYHAECGTRVYSAAEIWGQGGTPYLSARKIDDDLRGSSWTKVLSRNQLRNVFGEPGWPLQSESKGEILGVRVNQSWWPIDEFRLKVNRELGWNTLPSNEFIMTKYQKQIKFIGSGRGHLVGLCQQQAKQLAREGWDYKQLLAFFYPGTEMIQEY